MDALEVRAEGTDDFFRAAGVDLASDAAVAEDRSVGVLRERVSSLIKDTIGCSMKVIIVAPGSVPRSEGGKLSRVLDTRPQVEAWPPR
jgi:phenylacetate-CoA ligase